MYIKLILWVLFVIVLLSAIYSFLIPYIQVQRTNSQVKVIQDKNVEVPLIETTAKEIASRGGWKVPIITGSSILLLLLFFIWRRTKRDYIKGAV